MQKEIEEEKCIIKMQFLMKRKIYCSKRFFSFFLVFLKLTQMGKKS